jgi:hypothetical protein
VLCLCLKVHVTGLMGLQQLSCYIISGIYIYTKKNRDYVPVKRSRNHRCCPKKVLNIMHVHIRVFVIQHVNHIYFCVALYRHLRPV